MRKRNKAGTFKFDVALSFAGSERPHAEALARVLAQKGISAFYDKDHAAELWGKDTKEFEEIYGSHSQFVVPFISNEYVKRDWTNFEFETAKREARRRQSEFILPIRVDEARLLGLHDTCSFLSLDQYSIEEIADAIEEKLRPPIGGKRRSTRETDRTIVVKPLSATERLSLGLIATSVVPLSQAHLTSLFPNIRWKSHLRTFLRSGLVSQSGSLLSVKRGIVKAFSDEDEANELNGRWIDALDPLRGHPDIAILLGGHLIREGRLDEAAESLAAVAETIDPGVWRSTYAGLLEILAEKAALRELGVETRLRVLHAVAICHSSGPTPTTALAFLERLQRNARRANDTHWLGQAYLAKGVVFHREGDEARSRRWYGKSLQLAREERNPLWEARCLSNLAQLDVQSSPAESLRLLARSIELKESVGDDAGVAGALEVQAVAFANLGDLGAAVEKYERARRIAKKVGYLYLQCLIGFNQAHTLYAFGKRSEARRHLRSARVIAETEGFEDLERRCLELEGTICFEMGKLEESIECFNKLLERASEAGDHVRAMCARHALGVSLKMTGAAHESRRHFSAGIRLAKRHDEDEWAARCIADRTREILDGGLGAADVRLLRQQANKELNRGAQRLAGLIWRSIAYSLMQSDGTVDETCCALQHAGELLYQANRPGPEWGSVVEELVVILWESARFRDAIAELEEWTLRASARGLHEVESAWLDQRANCLTELEEFSEGEHLHRNAAALAKRHGCGEQYQRSWHNLGECLLRAGKTEEAVVVLQESCEMARSMGDVDAELTSSHSYALAQRDLGHTKLASETLTKCRDRAAKYENWTEYVRAWLALANLAWSTGRKQLAERRYRRAMKEAKRHKCDSMLPDISVNLASLLRGQGKSREALKLLDGIIETAKNEPDGSVYFCELAEASEAAGEPEKALEAWQNGRTTSLAAEDMESFAVCSSGLAELQLRLGRLHEAEAELRSLLADKDLPTEDRVIALGQLLRVLLRFDDDREAQSEYAEFEKLARCRQQYGHYIDIHMAIFDQAWLSQEGDRLNGLRAYVQAMMAALEFADEEVHGRVLGHVLSTILLERRPLQHDELRALRYDFQAWLQGQGVSAFIMKLLITPLAIADQLYGDRGDPVAVAKRVEEIAESHDVGDVELYEVEKKL